MNVCDKGPTLSIAPSSHRWPRPLLDLVLKETNQTLPG